MASAAPIEQVLLDPGDPQVGYQLTKDQRKALQNLSADAVHNALGGGSRSGKTFLFCRQMLIRAGKAPGSRHLIARFRFNAAKTAVGMDTLPKVMKLCFPHLPPPEEMLDKTDWFFKLPNDSEIWVTGLDDDIRVEKVLGHEYATMFFNECSQIPWGSIETATTRLAQSTNGILRLKSYYDLNPPSKKHWSYRRFIEKKDPLTLQPLLNPYNTNYMTMNPEGNAENLDPGYLDELRGLGERARKRFLHGQFADDAEGQLWTEEVLAATRVLAHASNPLPEMLRIVIAVDPSGAKGKEDERSDMIGIIVAGLGTDGHGYVLEDLTVRDKPEVWGAIACDAYDRHQADRVIGEVNYGGDMVRAVIQAVNPDIPYKDVTASRGKHLRAEPYSALYEQGKYHHVGHFPELEDEMQAMLVSEYTGLRSPNRLDAATFAAMDLFPKIASASKAQKPKPKVNTAPRSSRSHTAKLGDGAKRVVRINTRTRR